MAPNRKPLVFLAGAASKPQLRDALQTKFLPLTDPKGLERTSSREETRDKPTNGTTDESYWEWSEAKVDVLSVANIEKNLIQAKLSANVPATCQGGAHDDYWSEGVVAETKSVDDGDDVTSPVQEVVGASYWDWPADQDMSKTTIENILAEEKAYQVVSGSAIEENLVNMSRSSETDSEGKACTAAANDAYWAWEEPVVAAHVNDDTHPAASYWDWDTEPISEGDSKVVQDIKEYEAARQILSVDHIQRNLQSQAASYGHCEQASDNYWSW